MTTAEILDYLRKKRQGFISQFLDPDIMESICKVKMSDQEWNDFTNFCDTLQENSFKGFYYLQCWEEYKISNSILYKYN